MQCGFVVCDDFKLIKTDVKIESGKIIEIGDNLKETNIFYNIVIVNFASFYMQNLQQFWLGIYKMNKSG